MRWRRLRWERGVLSPIVGGLDCSKRCRVGSGEGEETLIRKDGARVWTGDEKNVRGLPKAGGSEFMSDSGDAVFIGTGDGGGLGRVNWGDDGRENGY